MTRPTPDASSSLNWTAVAALYAALSVGLAGTLYAGQYRNAVWLALLGTGGGLTAYSRVLEGRGEEDEARRWSWTAGLVYAVFFLWTGIVLVRALLAR
ncbi:MAG: hypothetical protein ABEK84_07175 [Salinibacter sp.]